jgi:hypothetical protein
VDKGFTGRCQAVARTLSRIAAWFFDAGGIVLCMEPAWLSPTTVTGGADRPIRAAGGRRWALRCRNQPLKGPAEAGD